MRTALVFLMLAALFVSGCTGTQPAGIEGQCVVGTECGAAQPSVQGGDVSAAATVDKVEVIHFHGTHQCTSCIAVGDLAEKTVNTYFRDELDSGRLTFAHVNGEMPENFALVQKYGVTSASLWIGTYYANGTFVKEENINVWYRISNEQGYLDYLKELLEKRLSGELS